MKSFLRNSVFVYKIYSLIKNIVISKRGFTLIESLIALLAQCLIIMLIPFFIMTFSQHKHTLFDDRTYDLEMMIKDISDHLNHTDIKDVLLLKKGI
ncbi:prepilin-type N-terminal cleavage/methylation domain-containing protein [Staphylococcus schleiferi]|nr:prepilin-type N-terminal cleavage/methylation domain-containing protein [Staphylococcus schleiferi]